jgi:Fe-S-cluster containining protein
MAEDILGIYHRWLKFHPIDKALVARQQERVGEIVQGGKSRETALKIGLSAISLTEQLISEVEANNSLPKPIVCRAGCAYCCFTQVVELTPAEALLLGDYVDQHFPAAEKQGLVKRVARNLRLKAGQDKREVAARRRQLPCPLLRAKQCAVYEVRPLLCRAMHSLAVEQCRQDLIYQKVPHFEFYSHRFEIVLSISAGLAAGSQAMGCQGRPLDLAGALRDYFTHDRPVEEWLQGRLVFNC